MRRRTIPIETGRLGHAEAVPGGHSPVAAARLLARLLPLAVLLLPLLGARPPQGGAGDYTKYHDYASLTAELQRLARAHPELARLVSIGESRGGRSIWALEIAKSGKVPVPERPSLLIAANLQGDQVIGSELALFTAEWLLTQYATNAGVRQRVDESAFLVVPRVNPDGAEALFARPLVERRGNLRPYDDDADARVDEDPPEDLNGDGAITVMRVKDAAGPYRVHATEPRLLVRADAAKGESGGWQLYIEGTDNDRDGFYNEDGPGGVDLDRNFQHEYPYYSPDAGPHMVSEPETRALIEYVLAHPGIAAILTYGGSDNLVTAPNSRGELAPATGIALADYAAAGNAEARTVGTMSVGGATGFGFGGRGGGGGPPGGGPGGTGTAAGTTGGRPNTGQRPATTVNGADQEYFRAVSEKYRSLTGIGRVAAARKPAGAFFEYGYYQFGVPSFSTPGWGIEQATRAADSTASPAARPAADSTGAAAAPRGAGQRGGRAGGFGGPGSPGGAGSGGETSPVENDLRLLRWLDAEKVDGFAAWTPFKHPQLGDVEIGGFKPYALTNPPAAQITRLGSEHAEFALYLAGLFPHVRVASTKVTNHGGGVFRIEAEIENTGYLPTALAQGVTARAVQPVMVQLGVDPERIVTGANKTSFVNSLGGSGARQKYQWVIRGEAGAQVELKLRSEKAGSESVTLTLR